MARWLVKLMMSGCALIMLNSIPLSAQNAHSIEMVSVGPNGIPPDNYSIGPAISADGRYIAFESYATNLVSGDTNQHKDVFVYDRVSRHTERVSVASNGSQANASSGSVVLSANGRYAAFVTSASNLVSGDTNQQSDVFVYDRVSRHTERISVASDGSQANNYSYAPTISADGRFVTFASAASNLVSGDTNAQVDIFAHDRVTDQTTRISVASNGTQANHRSYPGAISADGRYITFSSQASNLVTDDTNTCGVYYIPGECPDVFVHDRMTGETKRVSIAGSGVAGFNGPSFARTISADGRYIAFSSEAANLVSGDTNGYADTFVYDRQTGQTTRISLTPTGGEANRDSGPEAISADGRFVTFVSPATNLVSGDTNGWDDIFLHDRQSGQTVRVNIAWNGAEANRWSNSSAISGDGGYIVFSSYASNLVPQDFNANFDVFIVNSPFVQSDESDASPRRNLYTTDTPTLTWNRLTWALTYDIQIATTTNFSASLVYEGATTGPQLEHTVTELLENGLYYWRVRGVGANGAGSWSAADEFVVDAG